MKLGVSIRNMGPESTRQNIRDCALAAERAGLDSLWICEHIAIPPDEAEGSGGRYLDPLITLSHLAAITETIKLGSGALILPYRHPLMTAKLVASLQELAEGRLLLGVGIGWMLSEFKALGLDMRKRASESEAVLDFLNKAFDQDVVELNEQKFIFSPRPVKPPIMIGGAAPHAIERAIKYGDGWMPMNLTPEQLKPRIEYYRGVMEDRGEAAPQIIAFTSLTIDNAAKFWAECSAYSEAGVTTLVHGQRYQQANELIASIEVLAAYKES
jgi:probable F420-dependent oxidoreductase